MEAPGELMRVASYRSDVTALGPGRRFGLWLQGCDLACAGCLAHETWDPSGGSDLQVEELVVLTQDPECDGVTISGGEPLNQPDQLRLYLTRARGLMPELDVLVYTGYSAEDVEGRAPWLFHLADAIVCGPFRVDLAADEHWRGSSNQTVVFGERQQSARLRHWIEDPTPSHHLQIGLSGNELRIVGIPRRGDLDGLAARLKERGFELRDAGWLRSTASPGSRR